MKGIRPGPYTVEKGKLVDIAVTAKDLEGQRVVVGRFPKTSKVDAAAQAALFAGAPEMADTLRHCMNFLNSMSERVPEAKTYAQEASAALEKAGVR